MVVSSVKVRLVGKSAREKGRIRERRIGRRMLGCIFLVV